MIHSYKYQIKSYIFDYTISRNFDE